MTFNQVENVVQIMNVIHGPTLDKLFNLHVKQVGKVGTIGLSYVAYWIAMFINEEFATNQKAWPINVKIITSSKKFLEIISIVNPTIEKSKMVKFGFWTILSTS